MAGLAEVVYTLGYLRGVLPGESRAAGVRRSREVPCMARPDDALFVALARKAGYPPEARLRALSPEPLAIVKRGRTGW